MQTRSKTRALRSKRSIYLSRVKSSHCRGRTLKCFKRYRCKKTRLYGNSMSHNPRMGTSICHQK